MRTTKWSVVLGAVLVLGSLLAAAAEAAPLTVAGSLSIALSGGGDPGTSLVGVAVIANPGFEKTITQHIPPFTLPVFIDGDVDESPGPPAGPRLLRRRFDTTLVLTNTTDAPLDLVLTLWDGSGVSVPLDTTKSQFTLGAHATKVLTVSDLLP